MNPDAATSVFCSFCGKNHHETALMIQSHRVAVCDECVESFNKLVFENLRKRNMSVISEAKE